MYVLGIETSCDDTSVSILNGEDKNRPKILSHLCYSNVEELRHWQGVVPEVVARSHVEKLYPLLKECFDSSNLAPFDIDVIAVTTHPGLLGSLLTGLNAAKSLSLLYKIPIMAINHIYAHIEAIHLTENISYPYLGLVISGGHTLFFLVENSYEFKVLGGTLDDAAGEAFDKGGKLMGLEYPAGAIIDKFAKSGSIDRFTFPIGLKDSNNCNLSYSGLKTSLVEFLQRNPNILKNKQNLYDICACYQHAIVEAICIKTEFAINKVEKDLPLVVGGGVACNSYLRCELNKKYKNVFFVSPKYCTDNGAMVANYALRTYKRDLINFPQCLSLDARGRFINKGIT